MAPIAGRPFLEILLISLSKKGIARVVLALGYMAEKVIGHFEDRYAGMDLIYEVERTPLGTGGAVRHALEKCISDHAFVFNGDTFVDAELMEIEHLWQQSHHPIIVAREVPNATRYGRLSIDNGCVVGFTEKGASGRGLINTGCYVLPRHALDGLALSESFSLEEDFLVPQVIVQPFDLYVTNGYFIDIGIPEDYIRAQTELVDIYY